MYEMDPTKTVGATEWIRGGREEWNQYTYFVVRGGGGGGGIIEYGQDQQNYTK